MHDFECIPVDWQRSCGMWKGKGLSGKGMCTGMGTEKDKGKGPGSDEAQANRPCADPECKFLATWHPTHCCHACEKKSGCHGPKCERRGQQVEQSSFGKASDVCMSSETLAFPVEITDGRKLQIKWVRGEEPVMVAQRFAQQHGIESDELADIVDFVLHAEGATPTADKNELAKDSTENAVMTIEPTKEDSVKAEEPAKAVAKDTEVDGGSKCERQEQQGEQSSDNSFEMSFDLLQDSEDAVMSIDAEVEGPANQTDHVELQLSQLKEMGFADADEQILGDLLASCDNDIAKVVEMLLLHQTA